MASAPDGDVAGPFVNIADSLEDIASLKGAWQAYSLDLGDLNYEWFELWSDHTRNEELDEAFTPGSSVPSSIRSPASPALLGILAAYFSARTAKAGHQTHPVSQEQRRWLRRELASVEFIDADRTLWEAIAPPRHMKLEDAVKVLSESHPSKLRRKRASTH